MHYYIGYERRFDKTITNNIPLLFITQSDFLEGNPG